jgi:superfamily II DNA or RNA helicase
MHVGQWWHSIDHDEPCRVVDIDTLWGQATCLVWLPRRGTAVRVLQKRLAPLNEASDSHLLHRLSYVSAGARIADALERDALVAPLEGTVIPLPHQLLALQRAISGDRIRYLLADEVGLGKTIEAGLILRELKIRGLARRILVVAPAGLVLQWQSELKTHFNEDFRLILPGSLSALRQAGAINEDENLWRMHDQVICPLDSVKPVESRRGWSQEQLVRYNRERFEDLVSAGWDLIIIDEAHRLGGSTEQVARFKLGNGLAQAAPYLLLLSATPHQGKSDAFRRLISFLDADALPEDDAISQEAVAPLVIRTEKRRAIDADGNPLFKPRFTQLVAIEWGPAHMEQRALYEAVTEYVRDGYNRAIKEKHTAVGFLMILMQRLITSSTAAIRTALDRRLTVLELPQGQLSLFPEDVGEDWSSLDGQQQLDTILKTRLKGLKDERKEVELLLSAARRCEANRPDVKAEALLERVQQQQRDENDPLLKVLIFTEFVPTQAMLAGFLESRGFNVVSLNGSMDLEERRQAQRRFAGDAQILISTDAGGEGLNLQFCHFIVNYDLPWNPMKIEQRIGRVDRIGQKHIVRAMNFALEGTVELRVREVLEQKLAKILEEFGVDKLADVLDSEEGGVPFEELFAQAIIAPKEAERRASALADEIRSRAEEARAGSRLLNATERLDPSEAQRITNHQMPYWTEKLTLGFLHTQESTGASVKTASVGYDIRWPNGETTLGAVFSREGADHPGATLLSLEDARVRALTTNLPVFAPGQPIPAVIIPDVSDKTSGVWSLWRISLQTTGGQEQRYHPLFLTEDGKVFGPTARTIWDRLIDLPIGSSQAVADLSGTLATDAYEASRKAAEAQGAPVFDELAADHRLRIVRVRKKGIHAFSSRRRSIERLGLPQVRAHRLRLLAEEEQEWSNEIAAREAALPDLAAVIMIRVTRMGSVQ